MSSRAFGELTGYGSRVVLDGPCRHVSVFVHAPPGAAGAGWRLVGVGSGVQVEVASGVLVSGAAVVVADPRTADGGVVVADTWAFELVRVIDSPYSWPGRVAVGIVGL